MKRAKRTFIWTAATLLMALALPSPEVLAKGGRPAETVESRARNRAEARDITYGRAVMFRAGHLPPLDLEETGKKHPVQPAHPTHYLHTTLPIIIQGAPNELALRRHAGTS